MQKQKANKKSSVILIASSSRYNIVDMLIWIWSRLNNLLCLTIRKSAYFTGHDKSLDKIICQCLRVILETKSQPFPYCFIDTINKNVQIEFFYSISLFHRENRHTRLSFMFLILRIEMILQK